MNAEIIDDQQVDTELPPHLADEAVEAEAEAPVEAEAPQVDYKAEFERLERANKGILTDLQEERRRRAEAERARAVEMEEIRRAILARSAPEAPRAPDKAESPVDYLEHKLETLREELRERVDALGDLSVSRIEEERARADEQRVASYLAESVQRKAAEAPDFQQAAKYVVERERQRLLAGGVPEDQVNEALNFELRQLSIASMRRGEDPATKVYELARSYGYQPAAAEKPADTIRKGQAQAARSLSTAGGGGSVGNKITMKEFLELDERTQSKIATDTTKWSQLAGRGWTTL